MINNLFTYFNNIEPKKFYFYLFIFLLIIFYFKNYDIGINSVFGFFIAMFIILFLNEKNKFIANNRETMKNKKIELIEPKSEIINKYDDIIDFLFSIQDFYIYNPQAYEEIINFITYFFTVYEDIKKNPQQTNKLFSIAENNMSNAINHLHSIIYNIPDDKNIVKKLQKAMNSLEKILNNYLNDMYDIHIKNITYDVEHKEITIGPKEHNFYNDDIFDFY